MNNANELHDNGDLLSTPEVADEVEVSGAEALAWAQDNGVQRLPNGYVWTPEDVDDFLLDLDEAEGEDGDDGGGDADLDDDE